MMMAKRKSDIRWVTWILAFIFLFPIRLQAQDKFPLSECISLALKNSPMLKAEKSNVNEKWALYKRERAKALPQIESNSYFERTMGYNNGNVSVDISLDLQKVLRGYGTSEKWRFEAAKWQRKRLVASLVYLVKSTYFKLLLAQREYKAAEKAFETVKHHRAVAEALVNSGVKLKSALFRIDAQLERTRADLLLKKSNIKEANLELLKLIGLPLSTSIKIDEYQASFSALSDSRGIIQRILAQSPELEILKYEYDATRKDLRLSKGFFLPKLSLGIGYNRDGSPGGDGTYQDYHISASFPIFDFGKNIYEIQRIRASAEKIKWQMEEKKREIRSKVTTLYEKAKIMREKYFTYKKALEDIRKSLELSEKEYAAGIISESALLDIERNTLEIEVKKDNAFYDYVMLLAGIEYLKGGTK